MRSAMTSGTNICDSAQRDPLSLLRDVVAALTHASSVGRFYNVEREGPLRLPGPSGAELLREGCAAKCGRRLLVLLLPSRQLRQSLECPRSHQELAPLLGRRVLRRLAQQARHFLVLLGAVFHHGTASQPAMRSGRFERV